MGKKGLDEPRLFFAWLNTLRWICVASPDPRLFLSPWRAGIQVMTYQLEPLRKALLPPRVNLLIADERARRIVVAAPPSVVLQWRDELEQRFGLPFLKLRELHDTMDRAVLDAYGWADTQSKCEFLLDYEEEEAEDDDGQPSKKKKPWRYRWPDDVRDDVLARLLALNRVRAGTT